MGNLNLEFLDKQTYFEYLRLIAVFFTDDCEDMIINFDYMKDPLNKKVIEGINVLYELKGRNKIYMNKMFNNFIFPFLTSLISITNYNKISNCKVTGMFSFHTYTSRFYDLLPLNDKIKKLFYKKYAIYSKKIISNNLNDNIILDFKEKGKIRLVPYKSLYSNNYFPIESTLIQKYIQYYGFDDKFYKKDLCQIDLNYLFFSPFFYLVYKDLKDSINNNIIGFVFVLPSSLDLIKTKSYNRPINLNRFKINSYSNYIDDNDLIIYSYINADVEIEDLASEISKVIENKLKNNELKISANKKFFDNTPIQYLSSSKNIISKSLTNAIDKTHKQMDYYFQGRFYFSNIKKLKAKFYYIKTFLDGSTYEDNENFLNFTNYCLLKDKDYKNFEKNIEIKKIYKGIYRNLLIGNVFSDPSNPLKVNIVLDKKLDDEKIINYIMENYCLINHKLEICITFVDGEELKHEIKI